MSLFLTQCNMFRNSLQQQCELQHQQIEHCVQNPQIPWKHKKPLHLLQLACLHLNINIYQHLIAVCFVLIHLHLFFSALALINARTVLKSGGEALLSWHSRRFSGGLS